MSKGLTFFLGILIGIMLTLGFFVVKDYTANQDGGNDIRKEKQAKLPDGVTILDEPIPFTEAKNFQVMQVVFKDGALARSEKRIEYTGSIYYSDPVVLILADQESSFYDDQIVKAPKNCKVMQFGTYNYQTKMGWKTVPIIRFVKAQ